MVESDEEFEKAEAGASHTYPIQAGNLKKGDFAILKGHPCKVVEIRTSKTGKHGHAKANITGLDIFTSKKYEDSCPTSHSIDAPFVKRVEYSLLNITEDGFVELMLESGNTKSDLKLPVEEEFKELSARIMAFFDKDVSVNVQVIEAMGDEKIVDVKEQ